MHKLIFWREKNDRLIFKKNLKQKPFFKKGPKNLLTHLVNILIIKKELFLISKYYKNIYDMFCKVKLS